MSRDVHQPFIRVEMAQSLNSDSHGYVTNYCTKKFRTVKRVGSYGLMDLSRV